MDILVLGVGNVLLTDEGIGVRALKELERRYTFPENVELLDGVLEVLFPGLAVPVVAERDCQRSHIVYLGDHMQLESAIFTATDGDQAVVIIIHAFVFIEQCSELRFPLCPIYMNLLFR